MPLAGGTLTGPLLLAADPSDTLGAATKGYVDTMSQRVIVSKLNARQKADTLLRQMVLTQTGGLISWGRTFNGNTGTWYSTDITHPQTRPYFNVAIPAGVTIVDFATCASHSMCLLSNGWMYSTGQNDNGQLGHGDTTQRNVFTRIEYFVTNNITVSKFWTAGSRQNYSCAMTICQASNGDLYAWGYNANGQLGINSTTNALTPTKITTLTNVSQVVISDAVICSVMAIKTNGDLYGWGYNGNGQLGTGNTTQYTTPQLITSAVSKVDITTGGAASNNQSSTIVLKTNGDVYTTGYNGYGQLGQGDLTQRTTLTKVASLSGIIDIGITGGYAATCYAVSSANRLYTWGYNGYGTVGDNTTTNATSPYNVNKWAGNLAQDPPFVGKSFSVFMSTGSNTYNSFLVIDSDGRIFLCGKNSGMVNGSTDSCLVYNEILPTFSSQSEKAVSAVYMQSDTDMAITIITNLGNIYSVGRNNYGLCNTGLQSDTPTYRYTLSRQMLYV